VAIFCQQLGDDTGIIVGIPAKDYLRHLPGQVIIGLTQLYRLDLRDVELLLDS
jgi:hypothetical protein